MIIVDSLDVNDVLVDGMDQAKVVVVEKIGGGKTAPFCKGMGRVGLGAVPTTFPFPGKTGAVAAVAADAAAFAAWYWAALCLLRACLAGPPCLLPPWWPGWWLRWWWCW